MMRAATESESLHYIGPPVRRHHCADLAAAVVSPSKGNATFCKQNHEKAAESQSVSGIVGSRY